MEVFFTSPYIRFVAQNDAENTHIYILGEGYVEVQKSYNNLQHEAICELEVGSLINDVAALFETPPYYHYTCKSYCTIARIRQVDFDKIMKTHKDIKALMIKKLYENPYDIDRNYFCL